MIDDPSSSVTFNIFWHLSTLFGTLDWQIAPSIVPGLLPPMRQRFRTIFLCATGGFCYDSTCPKTPFFSTI